MDTADAPRFPWRGLMIDVVRHWQPIDMIERTRHEGVLVRGAFFLYDHRRVLVTALLLGAVIVWIVRRRRRRRAA